MRKGIIYIAGPMTGYDRYNFDAFYEAEKNLISKGWDVINPARLDEDNGFNPDTDTVDEDFMKQARARDVHAIMNDVDAIALLPMWEKSVGVNAEKALAEWCGKPVYLYPSMTNLKDEGILEEAIRITGGDRQADYGPPDQDFRRTADMWSIIKGVKFEPRDVAMFMICLKLSRETHQRKRDNAVDIGGYAKCLSICNEAEKRRNDSA